MTSRIKHQVLISKAIELLNADRDSLALSMLTNLSAERTECPELNYPYAIALARSGEYNDAIQALDELLAALPKHRYAQLLRAEICNKLPDRKERYSETEKELTTTDIEDSCPVLAEASDDINSALDSTETMTATDPLPEVAEKEVKSTISEEPRLSNEDSDRIIRTAMTELSKNQIAKALLSLKPLKKFYTHTPVQDLYYLKAIAYAQRKRYNAAIRAIETELKAFPDNIEALELQKELFKAKKENKS